MYHSETDNAATLALALFSFIVGINIYEIFERARNSNERDDPLLTTFVEERDAS